MQLYFIIGAGLLGVLGLAVLFYALNGLRRPQAELREILTRMQSQLEASDRSLRDELARLRTELLQITANNRSEMSTTLGAMNQQMNADATRNREESSKALTNLSESLSRGMREQSLSQQTMLDAMRIAIDKQMTDIRTGNEKKLDEMRQTVDEKLQQTLETRLGESFRLVSERLEQVHKSLGEMKSLANGVGDLKKVLSNVSTRGAMGELQLENIISQLLSPEQYEKLYKPRARSNEVVEFAIKLPGKDDNERPVFMPIDAKFPLEDYHNLVNAYELGDTVMIETSRKALINRIKSSARDIRDKYINPPNTTDFALLFLPIEGLFAEALRDPSVFETIQREMHVIITGPTTLAAILNSLQLGFRSLAIEKRSSEVWRTLSAVKTQFGKFGELLDKTRKKMDEASKSLGEATDSTRKIERKLQNVQELSPPETIVKELDIES